MSETKFTPGPWTFKYSSGAGLGIWVDASKALGERYSKDCPAYHIAEDAPNVQIAYELWTQFPRAEWDEMQQANGRLIAAAPDLYEALEACVAALPAYSEEAKQARAAIAKATGEQQ